MNVPDLEVYNIAFTIDSIKEVDNYKIFYVKVVDLNNTKNKALLSVSIYPNKSITVNVEKSNFKEGKRKYQMMYIAEKDKEIFTM